MTADDVSGRVTIHLTTPDPELLEKLSVLLYPAPPGTPMEDQEWKPIPGTGPYAITAAGPDGVTLTRNPYFQQWSSAAQPDGYPDVIMFRMVASEAQAVDDVLNGVAAGTFTDEPLPLSVTSRPAFVHQYALLDLQMIYPNSSVPPFNDKRVRQALNYALDRNAPASLGGPPGFARPTCQLIPPGIPGYQRYCPYQGGAPDGEYQGPDLGKARALVAESGTTGIPIVVYYYAQWAVLKDRAEYTATVLRDLGYQVRVEPIQRDAPQSVKDQYQIWVHLGWVPDYPLPGTFYDGAVSCAGETFTHYCNPTIQALAERARSLRRTDPAESLSLWAQVDHLLTEDAALVPVINRMGSALVSPDVGNVMPRSGFGPPFAQMWVR
jgi:peptide/nickel transport system substrate-binding protein